MNPITAQQSRDARRELGLSQADVTKALDFNRQYLSEFETGFSTRLTNAQLKKLRSFYESKIEEANANGEDISISFGESEPDKPPIIETYSAKRVSFLVADGVSDEVADSTISTIAQNDERLSQLLKTQTIRDAALFGDGEFSSETLEALRESFSLLAANYLLIRTVSGWPQLGLSASNINPANDSVLAIVINEFSESFRKAKLVSESAPGETPELEIEE